MGFPTAFPANSVSQDKIACRLKRQLGRPPQEVRRFYADFSYQAWNWKKSGRAVATETTVVDE